MTINKYLSSIESFENKKILITGATAGIGLALADQLLFKGANVVFLIRNLKKAEQVKSELLTKYPDGQIDIIKYDQSDYSIIESAVKEIKEKHSDFDMVVLNAGILYPKGKPLSKQGYPLTIDTNFLGLQYFLNNLVPLFTNKRYVFHGSLAAGFYLNKKWDIYSNKYGLFKQYNISKACVEALWYHYYANNKDNEFLLGEPGIASSDIFRHFGWFFGKLGKFLVGAFCNKPNKAALTLLKCLESHSKNGDYFVPRGLLTIAGYPKCKKFPRKREREYLINKTRN